MTACAVILLRDTGATLSPFAAFLRRAKFPCSSRKAANGDRVAPVSRSRMAHAGHEGGAAEGLIEFRPW